jgi:ABC-type multidrug transport system fused ATPase/permease subunit
MWPPVDEEGYPKPVLSACLIVLSVVIYQCFYASKSSKLKKQVQERKKAMRVAQSTSILLSQRNLFHLEKKHIELFVENDTDISTVFHAEDDLTVKMSCLLPMVGAESVMQEVQVKGRKLKAVQHGGVLEPVNSTRELQQLISNLSHADFPVTFTLDSVPPEARRIFQLVVDNVYQERVAEQPVYSNEEKERFLQMESLLEKRIRTELEEGIQKTLQARGMEGADPVEYGSEASLPSYQSGEKLRDIISLVKGSGQSPGALEFFPNLVEESLIQRAELTLRRVRAGQVSRMSLIWHLLAPALPSWTLAVLLHSLLEVVVAQLGTGAFASKLVDLVSEGKIDQTGVKMLTCQWLCGWTVLKVWGWFSSSLFSGRAERMFGHAIRTSALRSLLQQDFEYFDKHSVGSLNGRLHGDAEELKRNLLGKTREFISEGTAIIANAYLVYTMTPFDMFLASMVPLPLVSLGQMWLLKLARRWDRQAHFMREDADSNIGQVLGEMKTVRDFATERQEISKFEENTGFMVAVEESHSAKRNIIGHLMHLLHVAGEAVTIVVGAQKVANGELKAGELVLVMAMLSGMVGGKLRGMIDRIRELSMVMEPAGRICDLLQTTPNIEPTYAVSDDRCPRLQGRLEFDHVEFRYPTELRVPAIRDVTFVIEPGQMAGIVGHAGCGKSTIFKLIKRLYDPTQGRILLDNKPLPEYSVHHLRRKIAVVAQENILFNTTLRENIVYGMNPQPSDEQVQRALRQASALEFVDAFPDKIYTMVGSRGLTLSGGQRQRIAIARAMIRQPQILILDEATSALDPENEKIVQSALDELISTSKATALVIAHRLTTIKECNPILVLNDGRVVEQGTHEELLAIPVQRHPPRGNQKEGMLRSGYYHSQWNNMMGKAKTEAVEDEVGLQMENAAKEVGEFCGIVKGTKDKDLEIELLRMKVASLQKELEFQMNLGKNGGRVGSLSDYSKNFTRDLLFSVEKLLDVSQLPVLSLTRATTL